ERSCGRRACARGRGGRGRSSSTRIIQKKDGGRSPRQMVLRCCCYLVLLLERNADRAVVHAATRVAVLRVVADLEVRVLRRDRRGAVEHVAHAEVLPGVLQAR